MDYKGIDYATQDSLHQHCGGKEDYVTLKLQWMPPLVAHEDISNLRVVYLKSSIFVCNLIVDMGQNGMV